MIPDPWRQLAGAAIAALVVGCLAWLVGVPVMQSVLVGLVIVAVAPILATPVDPGTTLPSLPPRLRQGARVEVSRLSWSMSGRRGTVDARVVRRLQAIAHSRLADLHLDPEDPQDAAAVEGALGAWAYSVVFGDRTELARGEVVRLVEAIESLDVARRGGLGAPDGKHGTMRRSRS